MSQVILWICILLAFICLAGMHIYTMRNISKVQYNLEDGSEDDILLERSLAACWVTTLVLFLTSTFVGLILYKVIVFEMLLQSFTQGI